MADAKVRVRLDTAQARQDLRALYGEMGRPPSIPARGEVAGAPGAGGGGGGGRAPGVGGIAAGVAIGGLTASALKAILSSTAVKGLSSSLLDDLAFSAFGPGLGTIAGAAAARGDVSSKLGLAVGVGALKADSPLVKELFELSNRFGPAAAVRGGAQIRGALGGEQANAAIEGVVKGLTNAFEQFLPALLSGIGEAVADGIRKALP